VLDRQGRVGADFLDDTETMGIKCSSILRVEQRNARRLAPKRERDCQDRADTVLRHVGALVDGQRFRKLERELVRRAVVQGKAQAVPIGEPDAIAGLRHPRNLGDSLINGIDREPIPLPGIRGHCNGVPAADRPDRRRNLREDLREILHADERLGQARDQLTFCGPLTDFAFSCDLPQTHSDLVRGKLGNCRLGRTVGRLSKSDQGQDKSRILLHRRHPEEPGRAVCKRDVALPDAIPIPVFDRVQDDRRIGLGQSIGPDDRCVERGRLGELQQHLISPGNPDAGGDNRDERLMAGRCPEAGSPDCDQLVGPIGHREGITVPGRF
jgi:hypothetical protein